MVKELMQSNKTMRDTIEQLSDSNEGFDRDLYHMQVENRDLRDRIEILESVIATTTHQSDFDALDWRQLLLTEEGGSESDKKSTTMTSGFGMQKSSGAVAIQEMATELIESKKANRQMNEELELLRA